jgi:hypothetical protein
VDPGRREAHPRSRGDLFAVITSFFWPQEVRQGPAVDKPLSVAVSRDDLPFAAGSSLSPADL